MLLPVYSAIPQAVAYVDIQGYYGTIKLEISNNPDWKEVTGKATFTSNTGKVAELNIRSDGKVIKTSLPWLDYFSKDDRVTVKVVIDATSKYPARTHTMYDQDLVYKSTEFVSRDHIGPSLTMYNHNRQVALRYENLLENKVPDPYSIIIATNRLPSEIVTKAKALTSNVYDKAEQAFVIYQWIYANFGNNKAATVDGITSNGTTARLAEIYRQMCSVVEIPVIYKMALKQTYTSTASIPTSGNYHLNQVYIGHKWYFVDTNSPDGFAMNTPKVNSTYTLFNSIYDFEKDSGNQGAESVWATGKVQRVTLNAGINPIGVFNIGGYNYFKLRDIARLVTKGRYNNFSIDWDASKNAITLKTGERYVPVGGELDYMKPDDAWATPATAKIYLNGREIQLEGYNIRGNNYYKLRDVADKINFYLEYYAPNDMIEIDTTRNRDGKVF